MEPLLAASSADFLGHSGWLWLAFLGCVVTLLVIDLGVLHREDRENELRESLLPVSLHSLFGRRRDGGGPGGGVAMPVTEAVRS